MPGNWLSGKEIQSALAATQTVWYPVDLRGFKEIAIQVKYGTCTGTGNTAVTLVMQTSNDNVNWATLLTISSPGTDVATLSKTNVFKYLPDGGTAEATGFGHYIRFHFEASGTFAANYTITWEAKS